MYFKVSIPGTFEVIHNLQSLGIDLDHIQKDGNSAYVIEISQHELNIIKANNIPFKILIQDLSSYYVNRNKQQNIVNRNISDCFPEMPIDTPKHFHLGSMGGYYTYEEYLTVLDSMHILFPDLITTSKPINSFTTFEGHPIYWVKISDNPNKDENEPKALFTALHHAREPISLTQMVYFMWYLLENYGKNKEINALINRTELFFVPMVNPDGYIYNQVNSPQGGGLWRKNLSPNIDLNPGTDLNRNYGYNWGYDDLGSSPFTDSEVFRGANSFSEVETQAVKSFCEAHPFEIALNYHGYGNFVLYPWGYDGLNCSDSVSFQSVARQMVEKNKYTAGSTIQTVGYYANGNSDDWMYGDNSLHDPILSMTIEVGEYYDGFWPPESRILPLCTSTLNINMDALRYLHNYIKADLLGLPALAAEDKSIKFKLKQLGKRPSSTVISLLEINNKISFSEPAKIVYLDSNKDSLLEYPFSFNNVKSGDSLKLIVKLADNIATHSDTIDLLYFDLKKTFFKDDCSTMDNWIGEGTWGISNSSYVSPGGSLSDSPNADYAEGVYAKANSLQSFYIDNSFSKLYINYNAKWSIERNWDYAAAYLVNTTTDEKTYLCTRNASKGKEFQVSNEPIYEGNSLGWKEEVADISNLIGSPFNINFRISADGNDERDGIDLDDIEITAYRNILTSDKTEKGSQLSIYPIPLHNELNIKSDIVVTNLQLMDIYGRTVWDKDLNQSTAQLYLPSYINSGTYIIKLKTTTGTLQFIKCIILKD